MARGTGLQMLLAVARHQAAGETGVPPEALDHPFTVPTANGNYPPEADGITPLAEAAAAPETGLTRRQEMLLSLLLNGSTLTAAARIVAVNRQTAATWTRHPAFAAEFRRQRQESMAGAMQKLSSLVDRATEALADALHPNQDIGVRVRAAVAVLHTVGLQHVGLANVPRLAGEVAPPAADAAGDGDAGGEPAVIHLRPAKRA
jgi:hypothetical protein